MATTDIPGYILQKDDTSGSTNLKFDGMMEKLLACIDPDLYRNYTTTYEKGHKIMYDECLKDLYETLDEELLFWVKLSNDMERWGFNTYQYDRCVMHKEIKGEQCTPLRKIDDIKTSHRDPKIVTNIIDLIRSVYGRESPLTATHGKVHKYIGMNIDFSKKGKINFTIYDYIDDMLEDLPEDT